MNNLKSVYFISDAHLGCRAISSRRMQERRLVRFLDDIKLKAAAVYMLGDMFDFWFEYRSVVPKGFTRFLGKVSELCDAGVEVHFFTGNHDIWCWDYLEQECGAHVHHGPMTIEIADKTFYLAHGDGLGSTTRGFRFIRSIFHNRVCQWLFRWLHPDLGVPFGLNWAKHSRLKHDSYDGIHSGEEPYMGEDKEPLVVYAKDYLKEHPDVNYLLFGHRHIELDLMLSKSARMLILGDWVSQYTYAVFDGENLFFENYVEGDSIL